VEVATGQILNLNALSLLRKRIEESVGILFLKSWLNIWPVATASGSDTGLKNPG
jgi:hypothetical protein